MAHDIQYTIHLDRAAPMAGKHARFDVAVWVFDVHLRMLTPLSR